MSITVNEPKRLHRIDPVTGDVLDDEAYQIELFRDQSKVRQIVEGMARHDHKLQSALAAIFVVIANPGTATFEERNAAFNAYFETVRPMGLMTSDCALLAAKARERVAMKTY